MSYRWCCAAFVSVAVLVAGIMATCMGAIIVLMGDLAALPLLLAGLPVGGLGLLLVLRCLDE